MISQEAAASANLVRWPAGRPLVRCHESTRQPTTFNPSPASMRFRPVVEDGAVVATAYAAEDGMVALAETVLREAITVLPVARLRGLEISLLEYARDLVLVQLNGPGLRRLGLRRADVIDSGPDAYPRTAAIAQALFDEQEGAQGIVWTSHQSDHGDAAVLWDSRIDAGLLSVRQGPVALDGPQGLSLVQAACERFGILLEF